VGVRGLRVMVAGVFQARALEKQHISPFHLYVSLFYLYISVLELCISSGSESFRWKKYINGREKYVFLWEKYVFLSLIYMGEGGICV